MPRLSRLALLLFAFASVLRAAGISARPEPPPLAPAEPVAVAALDPTRPTLWIAGDSTAANGGPTATHALLLNSPAIGAGINLHFAYDQRGVGFNRTVGVAPDIGAFERQGGVDDLIFSDGFEPPL